MKPTILLSLPLLLTACAVESEEDVEIGEEQLESHSAGTYTDGALFRQNFESMSPGTSWPEPDVFGHGYHTVRSYTTNGIDGRVLRAKYVPSDEGSPRLNHDFPLAREVTSATLSYDVKFDSDFDFTWGGKLHGLAGGDGTAGCEPPEPDGWSVRVIWNKDRTHEGQFVPALYMYDYDRMSDQEGPEEEKSQCGRKLHSDFHLQKNVWYRIDLYVKMNTDHWISPPRDGEARLYVDGVEVARQTGLRFAIDPGVDIDLFRFSTFFGGSTSEYSPPETEYAYFDNFTVKPGLNVTGNRGKQCEMWKEGIYNRSSEVCCDDACGSCGGSGCGSLPGGGGNCCTGTIQQTDDYCAFTGISAPCYWLN